MLKLRRRKEARRRKQESKKERQKERKDVLFFGDVMDVIGGKRKERKAEKAAIEF